MMSRSVPLASVLAACVLAGPPELQAQASAAVELVWHVPAGCPPAETVLERIDALAGSSSVGEERVRAEATIERAGGGRLRLTLRTFAGELSGERHIEGASCEDLAGAAAVNLVLLLQSTPQPPAAGDPAPPNESANPASAASALHPESRPTAESDDDAEASRPWRVLLQLPSVTASLGLLPDPSLGLALGGGLSFGRARIFVKGTGWLEQHWQSGRPDSGASIHRLDASLHGCWAFELGELELAPCLGASLEHVWARGDGARVAPRTAEATWIAAGIGARAKLRLSPWLGVTVLAEARLGAARPWISIEGLGRIGQLGPASIELGLGAEWIL